MVGKIDVTNQDFRPIENLLEYQRDFFQLRPQTLILFFWQRGQQLICDRWTFYG
jgi:hypothetical protein